jgi:GT2 family glycosyltransferase
VAFTDDDCVPQPGWLAALAAGLEHADVVQGRTMPDPAQADRDPFSYTITVEGEWGYYEACNIAYRRDLLDRLGGFDETFRYHGDAPPGAGPIYGEDVDLAWRARAAEARIVFDADALVLHDVRSRSFLEHLKDLPRWEGIAMAMAKNPRLRDRCHWRWFWVRSHPWALLAAAGLAVAGASRSPAGRLAGGAMVWPYVRFRTRVLPVGRRRHWPATIPLAFLTDLLEIGVFARASLRYRTLVL